MKRSLALTLYLAMAARRSAEKTTRPDARPDGQLIWIHAGEGATLQSLGRLAERLVRERIHPQILMTAEGRTPPDQGAAPFATFVDILPRDRLDAVGAFLDHWHPDLAFFAGTSLPPALIVETHARAIPLILADVKITGETIGRWRWRKGMIGALLSRFTHILAQDPQSAAKVAKLGGRGVDVTVSGRIEETTEPLPCNEAEHHTLAQLVQTRPVWLSVGCPQSEQDAVLAAHAEAMRKAHRMLLIFATENPTQAQALNERMTREGWIVGQRSRDEEPDPDVQLYIADAEGELGLWYRLAPVTYMGGTLMQDGAGRNPFEPAALGSAIVHGPNTAPYPDAYARLGAASASRQVATPAELSDAVCDLIAPDRAAILAHNAWSVSSGGAEVAERVVRLMSAALGRHPAQEAAV